MKKPMTSLVDLIKEKLEDDFHNDRFDPPERSGTPPNHEPVIIPKKSAPSPASEENPYHFTLEDFSGYEFRIMSFPLHHQEFNPNTLYLSSFNNQLVCTVSDPQRATTQSFIDVGELRNAGIKIELPLRSHSIEPVVPLLLMIHKQICISREKVDLADKTSEKQQGSYLQAYIELTRRQLNSEDCTLKQLKTYSSLSDSLKQQYVTLEKEVSEMSALLSNPNASMILATLAGKKNSHSLIDINSAGVNILSDRIKSIKAKMTRFEEEAFHVLKQNQPKSQAEGHSRPPNWTQRNDYSTEIPKVDPEASGKKAFGQ
jgi:hypothetical protein